VETTDSPDRVLELERIVAESTDVEAIEAAQAELGRIRREETAA
jgi:hypothetical protein